MQMSNTRLFERRGHTLKRTAKGETYLPELACALDRIAAATVRLMEPDERPLRITVLPSFASRWLVPRLEAFRTWLLSEARGERCHGTR
jgi:LysR family glycine cleavage system transcriptional activator